MGPSRVAMLPEMSEPTADAFDRERVLALLDELERDVAIIESAMASVEAGDHESYDAAMTALDSAES